MRKLFFLSATITLSLVFCFRTAYSQSDGESSLMIAGGDRSGAGSSLFRDYQTIGINPANLGIFDSPEIEVTTGALEASGFFYSDALVKSEIISSLLGGKSLSTEEKLSIAQDFLESGNSFSVDGMMVGFALQSPKLGGFGFSWRERITGGAIFSHALADIVFNGINSEYIDTIITDALGQLVGIIDSTSDIGDLFNGSSFQYNWLREYNLSYGRKIAGNENFSLYAGVGLKFMQSNAIADIAFNGDTISGFAAFSKIFDIDYANFTDPDFELKGRFSPVGKGIGLDFGLTASINKKFFVSASVTDIGSIKYTGNLVTINDAIEDSLITYIGINYADIFTDLSTLFNADGLFSYLPEGEHTVNLPTTLRLGAGYRINQHFDLAADLIQPFNKVPGSSLDARIAGLVNWTPSKAVRFSGGFVTGGYADFDVPLGVSFSLFPEQVWQFSIGTGDIISIVKQNKPTVSLSLSLLRFHYE